MHKQYSLALLFVLASCADEELPQPTAKERPELVVSYDVATARVEDDVAGSLEAIRRTDVPVPVPGTPGPLYEDFEGAINPNVIWGSDTRVRVSPTTSFPAAARVRLVLEFSDGYTSAGSGMMIGRKHVLTAGHVVYSHNHGGWATKISAFPGQDASLKPYSALATKLRSNTGWTQDEDSDYDYGLITLNSNLGDQTGIYGYASFSDDTLDNTTGHIYGYPSDKAWGTQWGSGGVIETYNDEMVYYDTDTMGGQSGAGVYRFYNDARYVFAVHIGSGWWWLNEYNRAARITNARFYLIQSWIASGT